MTLLATFACSSPCRAVPEANYIREFHQTLLPFLNSGHQFTFPSADGRYTLQGVRFTHPNTKDEKGLIVVINGFSQSWYQYAELFYDLYRQGYSVISYDHRGQGLSPHLVPFNSQIGYIGHFTDYSEDLNAFMEKIVKPLHPSSKNLFLIASSMGGAITAEYLEQHSSPSPFQAVVLSAPMLAINTDPYPAWLAHLIVGIAQAAGLGRHYAIGKHDFDPKDPFSDNKITHSLPRWQADREFKILHPKAVISGPSNGWVNTSLGETPKIRAKASSIQTRVLLLEAGEDQLVINQALTTASLTIPHCRLVSFPKSRHGILMESDPIHDQAMREIEYFFSGVKTHKNEGDKRN